MINGLKDPFETPLTQLPMGTANILARELGLHRIPQAVANTVVNGQVKKLDLFLGNGRRFLAIGSVGLDATVTHEIKKNRKGALGLRGYFKPILRSLFGYRAPKLSIQIDDKPSIEGGMVVIGNIRNYAAFFHVTERARPDSGHLDVCILPLASPLALVCYGAAALTGMLDIATNSIYRTGKTITINSDPQWVYELDGDYMGETPLKIEVMASTLPFVV